MSCIPVPSLPIPSLPPGFSMSVNLSLPTAPFPNICCNVKIPNPVEALEAVLIKKALAASLSVVPSAAMAGALAVLVQGIQAINMFLDSIPPKCPKE